MGEVAGPLAWLVLWVVSAIFFPSDMQRVIAIMEEELDNDES